MGRGARALAALLVCAGLASPATASAATIPVDTTTDELNDGSDCSLREAVQAANTNAAVDACPAGSVGLDTVALAGGAHRLSLGGAGENANQQGDLDLIESLVIAGAGSGAACTADATTCIDADDLDRAIDVRNGANPVALTLRDVTLSDGRAPGDSGGAVSSQQPDATVSLARASILSSEAASGGGVDSVGALEISSSRLAGNEASAGGGAVSQAGSALELFASAIESNSAGGGGGGIEALAGAAVSLDSVKLIANVASSGDGGGLAYTGLGGLSIADSTIEGNAARNGGGLATGGPATIAASTFAGNRAEGSCGAGAGDGGGIDASSAPAITNSTISGNSAGCRGGGLRIFASAVSAPLTHVTVAGNSAPLGGGGLDNEADAGGPSAVTLRASILVANGPVNCGGDGARLTAGYNIESGLLCGFLTASGDRVGTDPMIGPLRFNGGPTPTQMPFTTSPALHAVLLGCPPPATDQRGAARPVASRCDIGAVESSPAPLCTADGAGIAGTAGNDTINGTAGRDVIVGLGGDDLIIGLGGDDLICAGPGNDFVLGGPGNDRLRGEAGPDKLRGNGGNDVLEGGLGRDRLDGGRGKDKLNGGPGKDKTKQ